MSDKIKSVEKEEIEIVQPVVIEWEDKEYTLDFNRDTAAQLQNAGFDMEQFASKLLTQPELLFIYSFRKNHPHTNSKIIREIFNDFSKDDKTDICGVLVELYNQTILSTWDGEGKKAKWRRKG